jgi:putative phosphoesterase
MKMLVFSDSHRQAYEMLKVSKQLSKQVSVAVHLGDGWNDMEEVILKHPHFAVHRVCGNCDDLQGPRVKVFSVEGKRFLATHGHMQHVKSGLLRLACLAEENEADVCLFGHTHRPVMINYGKIILMNPGSISLPTSGFPPSYGIISISENGFVTPSIVGKTIEGYRPLDAWQVSDI